MSIKGLQMRNIFKLIVVNIRLQQVSNCYRWIHVVLLTQRERYALVSGFRNC